MIIKSKRNIAFYLTIVSMGFVLILFTKIFYGVLIGSRSIDIKLLAYILGFIAFAIFLPQMFDNLKVSISSIVIKNSITRRKKEVHWNEIKKIVIKPNYVGSYAAELWYRKDDKALVVTAQNFRNHEEIIKAIIEAATLADTNIEIKFVIANEFGPPPYGIFKKPSHKAP
ncbi:MAG: hypothetical protein KC422_20540 [Trueperaceae bacterium]|nr:hypothetical protein [Trueperaceae bacterium]